jgi:hypothetical protein
MPERSAAQILLAQLDYEVAQGKRELAAALGLDEAHPAVCAVENIAEKVCVRWWVSRMSRSDLAPQNEAQLEERTHSRAAALAMCVSRIVERSGPIDPNSLQLALLGMSSDISALWGVLIESGMLTQATRQEYLDAAVQNTFAKVEDYSQKIVLANAPHGRAS